MLWDVSGRLVLYGKTRLIKIVGAFLQCQAAGSSGWTHTECWYPHGVRLQGERKGFKVFSKQDCTHSPALSPFLSLSFPHLASASTLPVCPLFSSLPPPNFFRSLSLISTLPLYPSHPSLSQDGVSVAIGCFSTGNVRGEQGGGQLARTGMRTDTHSLSHTQHTHTHTHTPHTSGPSPHRSALLRAALPLEDSVVCEGRGFMHEEPGPVGASLITNTLPDSV